MSKKLVGYCAVDSGQIMIVDPCYVIKERTKEQADEDYLEVCNNNPHDGATQMTFSGIAGDGVVSGGFGGDGNYPVYVEHGKDGLVKSLTIKFN